MDFSAYINTTPEAISASLRAVAAWTRINQKPSSVAFKTRAGTVLAAQTVRIEYNSGAGEATSEAGKTPVRKLTIFGVKDHPTVTDTDIAEGYRFVLNGDEYRVIDTMLTLGEVQASCEVTG